MAWTIAPEAKSAATLEIVAGVTLALRLSRWRSAQDPARVSVVK
ncbi:hypothetical protein [Methylocystis sp. H62]|nr:hypothetical protein [Methylocystis sp. H62]